MPQPVEIDVAVGTLGDRAHIHIECTAHVDPAEFVEAVQDCVRGLLRDARATTDAAVAAAAERSTSPKPKPRRAA